MYLDRILWKRYAPYRTLCQLMPLHHQLAWRISWLAQTMDISETMTFSPPSIARPFYLPHNAIMLASSKVLWKQASYVAGGKIQLSRQLFHSQVSWPSRTNLDWHLFIASPCILMRTGHLLAQMWVQRQWFTTFSNLRRLETSIYSQFDMTLGGWAILWMDTKALFLPWLWIMMKRVSSALDGTE